MRFWDTSAIMPLCLNEPQTSLIEKIAREDRFVAVWWATPVECHSAFARLKRENRLKTGEEDRARTRLSALAGRWTEVVPSKRVRDIAIRILQLHLLRAADSLQLAAALVWAAGEPSGNGFVCLDQRLREAARCEGFSVSPGPT